VVTSPRLEGLVVLHANTPPVINSFTPASDPTINEGEPQEFNVTYHDPDGDSVSVQWYLDGTPTVTADSYIYTSGYNSAGVYNITVAVSDGKEHTTREWTLTILDVNRPPVIDSYTPSDLEPQVEEGASLEFTHTSSDPDSYSLFYSWLLDSTEQATTQNWIYTPSSGESGIHNVTLVVSDGSLIDSQQWNVMVLPEVGHVALLSHRGYLDSSGYYHVIGEVKNIGIQAVHLVNISVTFYTEDSDTLGTRFDLTMLRVLLPSQKSPFEIVFGETSKSAKVSHYSLRWTHKTTVPIPPGLRILTQSSYVDEEGCMHIVGEIMNIGTQLAQNVRVIATYYDGAGNIVAAVSLDIDPERPELEPNQQAPFEIILSEERTPYVQSYEVTAESVQYAIAP